MVAPPTTHVTVKQPAGSKLCGAAVAAMALGLSLEDVIAHAEARWPDLPAWRSLSAVSRLAAFLAERGVIMGLFLTVAGGRAVDLRSSVETPVVIDMQGAAAILGVKSETRPGWFHWVFWDGTAARDPLPHHGETTDLAHYDARLVDVYPLCYFIETDWTEEQLS